MQIGLRQLLLLAATVLFVIAIFIQDENWFRFSAAGLACLAAAGLVREMGWDRTLSSGGPTSGT